MSSMIRTKPCVYTFGFWQLVVKKHYIAISVNAKRCFPASAPLTLQQPCKVNLCLSSDVWHVGSMPNGLAL
jgi:hypothetical protein